MIKKNIGYIKNINTGVVKDVVIKAAVPNKVKDIIIGGAMIVAGVGWLTYTAFVNGAATDMRAVTKTMKDVGLM